MDPACTVEEEEEEKRRRRRRGGISPLVVLLQAGFTAPKSQTENFWAIQALSHPLPSEEKYVKSKLNDHAELIFNIKRTDHYTLIPPQQKIM